MLYNMNIIETDYNISKGVSKSLSKNLTQFHYDSYLKVTLGCCKSFTPCSYASFSWFFYLSLGCTVNTHTPDPALILTEAHHMSLPFYYPLVI